MSPDWGDGFENHLNSIVAKINGLDLDFGRIDAVDTASALVPKDLPSIRFGLETALLDFQRGGRRVLFENGFALGKKAIPINGLVWMGDKHFMLEQINKKLEAGYDCIKLKIGAIDLDTEISLLKYIRQKFSKEAITLRVDANGAFSPGSALDILDKLSAFDIHSIEQPIKPGQFEQMRELCLHSPIPIALDEELIGVATTDDREKLLQEIQPQFIILKPTLVGGLHSAREWIGLAEKHGVGWWITSALESNIGLNAIAQFTAEWPTQMPQGLGTGQLYHNNIPSPLYIDNASLGYDLDGSWNLGHVLT